MKPAKATIKLGDPYNAEHEVNVAEFECIEEAVKVLGETLVLKHINYAQRIVTLSMERRRFIAIHEKPLKHRLQMRRSNKA